MNEGPGMALEFGKDLALFRRTRVLESEIDQFQSHGRAHLVRVSVVMNP